MNNPARDINQAYQELDLKPGASLGEVRQAYRRLARAYHPDLHPGTLGAMMRRINKAYQTLAGYLASLEAASGSRPGARPFDYPDFSEAVRRQRGAAPDWAGFADFTRTASQAADAAAPDHDRPRAGGGADGRAVPARRRSAAPAATPPDRWRITGVDASGRGLSYTVEVSGAPRTLSLPLRRVRECRACAGSGSRAGGAMRCPVCGGRGRVTRSDRVEVELPRNWHPGMSLTVPGEEPLTAVLAAWRGEV